MPGLDEWRAVLRQLDNLPAALRTIVALDAWNELSVLQHAPWRDAAFEDLVVCYDILETTLVELIEDKRAKLEAEVAAIIVRKGKPRT